MNSTHLAESAPYYLPNYLDPQQFRVLSSGARYGSPDRVLTDELQGSQERCHKIPNHVLCEAYNTTDDQVIRHDLLRLAYDPINIVRSEHNADHTLMENRIRRNHEREDDKSFVSSDFYWKGQSLINVLDKVNHSDKFASKTSAHLLRTAARYPAYNRGVAELDMRTHNTAAERKEINAARQRQDAADYEVDTLEQGIHRMSLASSAIDGRSSLVRSGELLVTSSGAVDQRSAAVRSGDVLLTQSGQVDGRSAAVRRGDLSFKSSASSDPSDSYDTHRGSYSSSGSNAGSSSGGGNSWNAFQSAHAGQGLSPSQMSAAYHSSGGGSGKSSGGGGGRSSGGGGGGRSGGGRR